MKKREKKYCREKHNKITNKIVVYSKILYVCSVKTIGH